MKYCTPHPEEELHALREKVGFLEGKLVEREQRIRDLETSQAELERLYLQATWNSPGQRRAAIAAGKVHLSPLTKGLLNPKEKEKGFVKRRDSMMSSSSVSTQRPKHYLCNTASWRVKNTRREASTLVDVVKRKLPRDENGRLVLPRSIQEAAFAKPVESRIGKGKKWSFSSFAPESSPSHGDWDCDDWQTQSSDGYSGVESASQSHCGDEAQHMGDGAASLEECSCPDCSRLRSEKLYREIEERTRLRDDSFYTSGDPASLVRLPFEVQVESREKAYLPPRVGLFEVLQEHFPDAQRKFYPEGPRMVRFGRDELGPLFGYETCPTDENNLCSLPPRLVIDKIHGVIPLRNAICHPESTDLRTIDAQMEKAQALCCVLQREQDGQSIRDLRDELQKLAREELQAIISQEALCNLPEAETTWATHRENLFSIMLPKLRRADIFGRESELGYHPAVIRAARAWGRLGIKPGQSDPVYIANLERKKALFRENGFGRRASFSVAQGCEVEMKGETSKSVEVLI